MSYNVSFLCPRGRRTTGRIAFRLPPDSARHKRHYRMWAVARVYCLRFRMSRTSLIASQTAHTHASPTIALCATSLHSILILPSRNVPDKHVGDLAEMVRPCGRRPRPLDRRRGRQPGQPHASAKPSTGASNSSFSSAHFWALPEPPNFRVPSFQRTSGRRSRTEQYSSGRRSGKFSSGCT